jgi:DNA (cytosine-5)-methyltransferase 1
VSDAICPDLGPRGVRCERWAPPVAAHTDGVHQAGRVTWPYVRKPRLLELFGGAHGSAVGFARAGFAVTSVDIVDHGGHPELEDVIVANACDIWSTRSFLNGFDVITGGPPCQRWAESTPAERRAEHPDLVTPMLHMVRDWASSPSGGLWVIENVKGAPLPDPVLICGRAMGLPDFKRHRYFASNAPLMSPGCACGSKPPYGVYGDHGDLTVPRRPNGTSRGQKARDVAHAQEVTGNDWMTSWDDLADSIPWRYTRFIGEQLIDALSPTPEPQREVVAS